MTNDSQLAQTNGTANITTESADFLAQKSARLNSRSRNKLQRRSAALIGTEAIASHPFVDVFATFSQRLHAKSLEFFYEHYPELREHLDLIPRKVESRTVWTPKVRQAIIHLAEALAVDLTAYAPFDLKQPFNDQGVRRMLPRLALLVAGRMKKEDAARRQLRYWLNQQRNREAVESKQWRVEVYYSNGDVGPAFT